MTNLLTIALICASVVPQNECRRDTALDVIVAPASTPIACAMQGQSIVAGSPLAESLTQGAYLKVVCERRIARAAPEPKLTATLDTPER